MTDANTTPTTPDRFAAARAAKAAKREIASATYGKVDPAKLAKPGFKLPQKPAQKWDNIAIRPKRMLPPPGDYDARIADIALHEKPDVLWMTVKYELTGEFEGHLPEAEFGAIAAQEDSPHANRVDEGARLLFRTAAAAGVELPEDLNPHDLPGLLEGKAVRVRIAHKNIDGVPALIVRKALPKAAA